MTRKRLSITVVDHRPGKRGAPRTKHYGTACGPDDHRAYLRDLGRLARAGGLTSEETHTTVHVYPPTSAVQAALFGGPEPEAEPPEAEPPEGEGAG